MPKDPILVIEKPDFVVRLHEDWIDVDLKKGGKAKLEHAIEREPLLRKTLGFVLQTTVPSDVELCDIKSFEVDDKGQLKLGDTTVCGHCPTIGYRRCKETCVGAKGFDTTGENEEES